MHRHKINNVESFATVVDMFLDLSPEILKQFPTNTAQQPPSLSSPQSSTAIAATTSSSLPSSGTALSKTIGANWNHYCLHTGESKYSNFHAYLFDAHYKIRQCKNACSHWSNSYQYQKNPTNKKSERTIEIIKSLLSEFAYDPFSNGGHHQYVDKNLKQLDSLQSLGESSGYESLRYRPEEDDSPSSENSTSTTTDGSSSVTKSMSTNHNHPNGDEDLNSIEGNIKRKSEVWKISARRPDTTLTDIDFSEDLFIQGTVSLGEYSIVCWPCFDVLYSLCFTR